MLEIMKTLGGLIVIGLELGAFILVLLVVAVLIILIVEFITGGE